MKSKTKKEVTVPGEYIGTQEEYESGFGTYKNSEEGEIRSSNTGKLKLDKKKHKAEVRAKTKIPKMQAPGTVILGKVTRTRDQVPNADWYSCRGIASCTTSGTCTYQCNPGYVYDSELGECVEDPCGGCPDDQICCDCGDGVYMCMSSADCPGMCPS